MHLDDGDTLTVHNVFEWAGDLVVFRRPRTKKDIGEFVTGDIQSVSHPTALLQTLGATPGATFAFATDVIGQSERVSIRNVVDAAYLRHLTQGVTRQSPPGQCYETKDDHQVEKDFKLELSATQLQRLVSVSSLDRVRALVRRSATPGPSCDQRDRDGVADCDRILVRRCAALGRCIPWHVDVSRWVCQVVRTNIERHTPLEGALPLNCIPSLTYITLPNQTRNTQSE